MSKETSITDIITEAEKAVIPSEDQAKAMAEATDKTLAMIGDGIGRFPEIIDVELGGSYAKGTWLTGADLDVFVRFKNTTSNDEFESIIRKLGFVVFKDHSPCVRYSQHPFIEAKVDKIKINLVPFYDVSHGRWKSAADRSTYHTKHVKANLDHVGKNQVRILKRFLNSAGIYGAEMASRGFSGYVSEVLILNFGGFEETVKRMASVDRGHIIGNVTKEFDTSIVIVDPIDGNRNLAAAISNVSLGRFILTCRAFIKNPGPEFFLNTVPKKRDTYWNNLLCVEFVFSERGPETIWGQAGRTTMSICKKLQHAGFDVQRNSSYVDLKGQKTYMFFLLATTQIPDTYLNRGPEIFRKDYCSGFIGRNIKRAELMWIDTDMRIVSLEKRKYTKAVEFVKDLLKKDPARTVSKGLCDDVKNGFEVYVGDQSLSNASVKKAASRLISTDGSFVRFNKKII